MVPNTIIETPIDIEGNWAVFSPSENTDLGSVNSNVMGTQIGSRDRRHHYEIETWEDAEFWANALTVQKKRPFLPVDRTAKVYPRFGVYAPPRIGDLVSFAFNGDSYPCGYVTGLSPSYYAIRATDGNGTVRTFRRRGKTGSWFLPGGTWVLCHGHERKINPEF